MSGVLRVTIRFLLPLKIFCSNCERLFYLAFHLDFDEGEIAEALVDHCDKYSCPLLEPRFEFRVKEVKE